jgi:NitT/TauT family transport system ATP-binding protein
MVVDTASRQGKTVVLVTHDIDEAIALSQRIYVLSARPGRVKSQHKIDLQTRSPLEARHDSRFAGYFDLLCQELDIQTAARSQAS